MALRVLNNQDVCLVTEIPCIGNPLQRHQKKRPLNASIQDATGSAVFQGPVVD